MENQTVYIVTRGEWNDYRIERVFSSREKAEAYCKAHPETEKDDAPEIEEWKVDDESEDE